VTPNWSADVEIEWDAGAGNVLSIVAGALLMQFGWELWNLLHPAPLPAVIAMIYLYLVGLGCLALGVTSIDFREHGRAIGLFVLSAVLFAAITGYGYGVTVNMPTSDATLFSRYAADLLIGGQSPYGVDMTPAWDRYDVDQLSITPKVDGTAVPSLSYPAGAVYVFVPQLLAGVTDLGLTTGGLVLALLTYLVVRSPPAFALAPIPLVLSMDLISSGFYGQIDVIWALPVVVAADLWGLGRRDHAAAVLGVACAMKQHPWFIFPFLAVWVVQDEGLRALARYLTLGAIPFVLINAPFILLDPVDWFWGLLTPLIHHGAPLRIQGVGLAQLTASGVLLLPREFYMALFALAGAGGLAAYAWAGQRTPRFRWIAWIAPALLLIWNYRSLQSYFMFIPAVAYLCALHVRSRTAPLAWPTLSTTEVDDVGTR